MNRWRRFRIVLLSTALFASTPGFASEITGAEETAPSPTAVPDILRPRIEIPCVGCGTPWKLPTVTALPSSPAPRVSMTQSESAGARMPTVIVLERSERRVVMPELPFRDNQPLINRLKRLRALPFVTLWDSTTATLYVGVNHDGDAGVHLRQKKHDRGTLAPAGRTLFVDASSARLAARATAPR